MSRLRGNVIAFKRLRAATTAVLALVALLAPASPATAGVANAGLAGAPATNPLAGLPWGTYTGTLDGVHPAYQHAQGRDQQLLGKIALRPLVWWFGNWDTTASIQRRVRDFLTNVTGGRTDVLAQMAVFRLSPWEGEACKTIPDAAAQAAYKGWIDQVAAAIGTTRVALILQPDLPFALCAPSHTGSSVYLGLVQYAAQQFNALPHTTVYIDAGAGDWISPTKAVWLLTQAGIQYARGFSVNDTHLDSTSNELEFGASVIKLLNGQGITDKHFVVNTSTNGRPFRFYKRKKHGKPAPACGTTPAKYCATLGIPPTSQTADPQWHLSAKDNAIAASEADAYLWEGRPWLTKGTFDVARAIGMAASSPF